MISNNNLFHNVLKNHITKETLKNIDFTYIKEVAEGDKDAEIKILKLFVEQVEENITELLNALQDKNYKKIMFYAHRAKNDLHIVGNISLSAKMYELENLSKNGKDSNIFAEIISLYIKETQYVIDEINKMTEI